MNMPDAPAANDPSWIHAPDRAGVTIRLGPDSYVFLPDLDEQQERAMRSEQQRWLAMVRTGTA